MTFDTYKKYIRPMLSSEQERENFVDSLHKPLKKSVNIIQNRINKNTLLSLATTQGRELSDTEFQELENIFYIDREDRETPLGSTWLHQAGYFYMQEVAASIPAHFLDLKPDALVLDMCAAPGGKTIQLADRMISEHPDNIGCIWANDVNGKRLKALQANINRSGLFNVAVTKINGYSFGRVLPDTFDAILLDAPCSGEGTSFRSKESLKHRKPQAIKRIANTQYQLLISALKSCKVGGSIIFSTCTINQIENEQNLAKLLEEYGYCCSIEHVKLTPKSPAVSIDNKLSAADAKKCVRCRPHKQQTGGFFVSKIKKTAPVQAASKPKENNFSTDFLHHNKQLQRQCQAALKTRGIQTQPQTHAFVESQNTIYLTSPKALEIIRIARCEKLGIPILKKTNDGLKPLHGLAVTLGHLATQRIIAITEEHVQNYSQKQSIPIEDLAQQDLEDGLYYIIKTEQNLPISVGKISQGLLKNKFIGV